MTFGPYRPALIYVYIEFLRKCHGSELPCNCVNVKTRYINTTKIKLSDRLSA